MTWPWFLWTLKTCWYDHYQYWNTVVFLMRVFLWYDAFNSTKSTKKSCFKRQHVPLPHICWMYPCEHQMGKSRAWYQALTSVLALLVIVGTTRSLCIQWIHLHLLCNIAEHMESRVGTWCSDLICIVVHSVRIHVKGIQSKKDRERTKTEDIIGTRSSMEYLATLFIMKKL